MQTIHGPIFSHFRTNQSALQKVHDPSMQTNNNLMVLNLMSKPHVVELPSRMIPTCHELVLLYVIDHYRVEK